MGTSTTCTMDRNISTTFTSTVWPANSRTSSGVTIGAMMVVHAVMPTDSATSPFARYVMTLELVPPGHEPTRITPTASSGGSWNTIVSRNASTGMMTNCARMPTMTAFGFVNTTLKSASLRVMPMPNITTPSRMFT